METEMTTLINTLLQNNLAGSLNEAKRMAQQMLGTSKKVTDGYEREHDHYMIKGYKPATSDIMGTSAQETPQQSTEASSSQTSQVISQSQESVSSSAISQTAQHAQSQQQQSQEQPEQAGPQKLSLENTSIRQERPEEKAKKEGLLAPGMPDTSKFEQQDLDPVTSAPREAPQLTPEQYSAQRMSGVQTNNLQSQQRTAPENPHLQKEQQVSSHLQDQAQVQHEEPQVVQGDQQPQQPQQTSQEQPEQAGPQKLSLDNTVVSKPASQQTPSQPQQTPTNQQQFQASQAPQQQMWQQQPAQQTPSQPQHMQQEKAQEQQPEQTQEIPPQPKEEKLQRKLPEEEVDLTQVFNVGGK